MTKVADVLAALEYLVPAHLAQSWDKIGLSFGSPEDSANIIAFALDPTEETIAAAKKVKAQVLITHHPLFFGDINSLNTEKVSGKAVLAAARAGISIICAHTNLDSATSGTASILAQILSLKEISTLDPVPGAKMCKIVTFVPEADLEQVSDAMFKAGAGIIGEYHACSFRVKGVGTFLPSKKSKPHVGKVEKFNRVSEIRLEVLSPWDSRHSVIKAMSKTHPYEEPAYDVYPLDQMKISEGFVRLGKLPKPMSLMELTQYIKSKLDITYIFMIAPLKGETKKITHLAVSPGSGAFALDLIKPKGSCALLTGELNYHRALEARIKGIPVIAAGHFATEKPVVEKLMELMKKALAESGHKPKFHIIQNETDPFEVMTNGD